MSSKRLNSSIYPIDGILTGTTSPGLSGTGSNSNEGVLHIPQISRTRASSCILHSQSTELTNFT